MQNTAGSMPDSASGRIKFAMASARPRAFS